MEGEGRTLRAVGFALLVLAATIAVPALSVAQDVAGEQPPAATAPQPSEPPPPPPPPDEPPQKDPAGRDKAEPQEPASDAPDTSTAAAPAEEPPAAASASSAQAKAASASVSVGDNFYSPTTVSIFAGETITWRNNGQTQHSATANDGSFDTGIFGPGASRSETFASPGTFSYYCTVHGLSQSGTVRVASTSGGNGGGGGGSNADAATSGNSEAAAVASPDAAGTSTSLPATGFAVLGLGGTGLILLVSGMVVERRAGRRKRGAFPFSIY